MRRDPVSGPVPWLTSARLVGVRRLTQPECDRLGWESPLVLSRREVRFVFGPWRRVDEFVVTHRRHGHLLVCSAAELRALGVDPAGG